MDLASIGLIVIAIAWLIQLYFVIIKNNKQIQPLFIAGYMVGVLLLIIGLYQTTKTISYYEVLTLFASAIVLVKILTMKK